MSGGTEPGDGFITPSALTKLFAALLTLGVPVGAVRATAVEGLAEMPSERLAETARGYARQVLALDPGDVEARRLSESSRPR